VGQKHHQHKKGKKMANYPVPFQGTREEAKANYLTHRWRAFDDCPVCIDCDAKEWHQAATYPCGTEPDRISIATTEEWVALLKKEITLEELRKREKCDTIEV
jgi:hypothetical protein